MATNILPAGNLSPSSLALLEPHEFSASQLEAGERCVRYWWGRHVARLPEKQTEAQLFGTTIHAVIERYMLADANGRDPQTGKPVELYPEGWSQGLNPAEADLVKRLVSAAIDGKDENQILVRHPETLVEAEFRHVPFVEGATVRGYIDLATHEGIQDHKSSKNVSRYAKSPDALRETTQMLLYAKIWLEDRREDKKPIPDKILIQHNYFSKDPSNPVVRPVRAWVTPREVDIAWSRMQDRARRLLEIKRQTLPASLDDTDKFWRVIPGAAEIGDQSTIKNNSDYNHPCRQYGGCPFADICCGVEKPSDYVAKINRLNQNQGKETVTNMATPNIFAARMAANGNTSTAPPAAATPTIPPPSPSAQNQPAPTKTLPAGAPPWGRAECGACEGKGFNTAGNVCRPCRSQANNGGKVSPDWFETGYENGVAFWEVKKEHVADVEKAIGSKGAGGEIRLTPATTTTVETRTQAPEKTPAASQAAPEPPPVTQTTQNVPAASQTPQETSAPTPTTSTATTSTATSGKSRAKKGFTLCVNCLPENAGNRVVRLVEVFDKYSREVAADEKVASYYEINAFRRWDLLALKAEKIIEQEGFGTKFVIGLTSSKDFQALTDALRPHADEVIGAVAL